MGGPCPCVVWLLLVACVAVAARPTPDSQAIFDSFNDTVSAGQSPTQNDTAEPAGAQQASCTGLPSKSQNVMWQCPSGTLDGGQCLGECMPGKKAPYGPPLAVCTAGVYTIQRRCMDGGVYGFDDVPKDGTPPSSNFLPLGWMGLRVTNSQNYTACSGSSGFRFGLVSGLNVAYTLEVGQQGDFANLARITAPTKQGTMAVAGFWATPAWQDGVRVDVAAWDVNNNQLGVQIFTLPFGRKTYINLRDDLRFSSMYKFTIISSGGQQASCVSGKQLVIDDLEAYVPVD